MEYRKYVAVFEQVTDVPAAHLEMRSWGSVGAKTAHLGLSGVFQGV